MFLKNAFKNFLYLITTFLVETKKEEVALVMSYDVTYCQDIPLVLFVPLVLIQVDELSVTKQNNRINKMRVYVYFIKCDV